MWNTELTQANATEIYNNGAPGDISSLSPIAWYKLNASEIFNSTSTEWSVDNNAYPSVYQSSLKFNGSSNYVNCGDADDLSFGNGVTDSPFSISAWVNITDATRFRVVNKGSNFSTDYEYLFGTSGSDILAFNLYDTGGTSVERISRQYNTALTSLQGQWLHLVGTYDGSGTSNGIKIYLNGSRVDNASNDLDPADYVAMENTSNPLEIGASTTISRYSNGQISNTAIFNTELTSTQITTIYNNGTPETSLSNSPVSWWKLDNTTTGLIDNGSASNNGTNNGATEYAGFVNALAGESSNMDSSNLVVSDLNKTSGYSPYALNFDGTNQEFDIPNVSTLELYNTDFTISFWCKVDASVTNPMFFEKYTGGGGWSLYVFNDLLRFYNGSSWTYISGAFQTVYADLWTNVTIVGDLASNKFKMLHK